MSMTEAFKCLKPSSAKNEDFSLVFSILFKYLSMKLPCSSGKPDLTSEETIVFKWLTVSIKLVLPNFWLNRMMNFTFSAKRSTIDVGATSLSIAAHLTCWLITAGYVEYVQTVLMTPCILGSFGSNRLPEIKVQITLTMGTLNLNKRLEHCRQNG